MPVRMCNVEAGGGVVSPSLCPGLGPATRTNVTGILPQVGISSISSAGQTWPRSLGYRVICILTGGWWCCAWMIPNNEYWIHCQQYNCFIKLICRLFLVVKCPIKCGKNHAVLHRHISYRRNISSSLCPKGTNMLGIRTVSCLSHYPTAASIDKLLSVSCSRPRPRGTNPFFLASVLAGNDVWWRWWSLKLGGGFQVLEGQIL